MALIRSVLHLLWMAITVMPYALVVVFGALLRMPKAWVYRTAVAWLSLSVSAARVIMGIRTRIIGMEHLPQAQGSAVVLLVKHQSAFETFLMPAIMPRPLAYVFKKELLYIPFFGWAIGRLDMIHIDRSQRTKAFHKVVQQGKALLNKGVWVIMFPEGTRIARGEKGHYKTGGARLAIEAGVPVVPIAVTSARVWPRKAFIKVPGVVDVSVGPAIPSVGREPDELMREVEAWIEAEMRRLDPEAYPQVDASADATSVAQSVSASKP